MLGVSAVARRSTVAWAAAFILTVIAGTMTPTSSLSVTP
jgi:hypothetical protein